MWTLFWKSSVMPNIIEQRYPEVVKRDSDLGWIDVGTWQDVISLFRDIWKQRIDFLGYGAKIDDLKVMKHFCLSQEPQQPIPAQIWRYGSLVINPPRPESPIPFEHIDKAWEDSPRPSGLRMGRGRRDS